MMGPISRTVAVGLSMVLSTLIAPPAWSGESATIVSEIKLNMPLREAALPTTPGANLFLSQRSQDRQGFFV